MSSSSASAAARGVEPTRAVLVGVDVGGSDAFDATLDELALLAASAGDLVVARVTAKRRAPDPALFVGSGKADEIKALVAATSAHGVIFDQALSPAQQRNLEQHLGVAVADRTSLILDIFGDRAQSHEGKLQVELARLQYQATRLVRRWSHLERQLSCRVIDRTSLILDIFAQRARSHEGKLQVELAQLEHLST
ncbi:MAG: hypothetical protein Q8M96_16460, partial [Rubrivivax sp.]|nr:hypothetical protein [Rubrivivax sp.]